MIAGIGDVTRTKDNENFYKAFVFGRRETADRNRTLSARWLAQATSLLAALQQD